ncbi:hypothetical protein ACIBG7_32845 [Nonomuraea sp. NPDC050328]|uniref:hypothetical protein n=1 Tax=Nonomuraea sp. NPDC050328 TaxID=3364361 RepID=UPI0037B5C203
MTLIEQVQRLRVAAATADDENSIKRRTGELVTLAEQVEAYIETVRQLANGVAELRAAGVSIDSDLPQRATQVIATLQALTGALPGQTVDAPLDEARARLKAVQPFVKLLRQSVEEAWATLRSREIPAINEDLVATLARSGIEVEDIHIEIEKAQSVLAILNNRAVPELGDVAKLSSALGTLRSCGERISRLVDPTLAKVILNAQGTTGMPLSSFTPEVLAGLMRLGILDRFWVRLQ